MNDAEPPVKLSSQELMSSVVTCHLSMEYERDF